MEKKRKEAKGRKSYLILLIIIVLIAAFFRLYALDLRPVHWDEGGAHAFFSRQVFSSYIYDPVFHGPFLYHITGIIFVIFGENIITLRILEALFGIALILLVFMLRKYIGTFGVITASLLLAISASMIYYSKFALHDPFFAFFTLLCMASLLLYSRTKEKDYLYLFALSAGFLVTVKENSYIFFFILFSYFIISLFYKSFRQEIKKVIKNEKKTLLISLILFIIIIILFYSSFFRSLESLLVFFKSIFHWVSASSTGGHVKPFFYFFKLLIRFEFPIFILGILGVITAIISKNKIYKFLAYWAVLTLLIMSLIPYKTPWNIIHLVLPLGILSGIFLQEAWKTKKLRILAVILLFASTIFLVYNAIDLNFYNYSNEKYGLVYVQTGDEINNLLKDVKNYEIKNLLENQNTSILVTADAWWPLPWYWRDKEVLFDESYLNQNNSIELQKYNIIIISKADKDEYEKLLSSYTSKDYHIRGGVDWIAWFKE